MAERIEATYPLSILVELDSDTKKARAEIHELVNNVLGPDAHGQPWSVLRFFERDDLMPTAEGFFEAELPAITVAPESVSGTATEAAPSAPARNSALRRLIEVTGLDTLGGADARAALCGVLNCDDAKLDELARIHGPELAYAYGERVLPAVAKPEHVGGSPESSSAMELADATGPPPDFATDPLNEIRRALSDVGALSEMLRERLGSQQPTQPT